MENNFENEINQELEREKFINFFQKNKIKIIFFLLSLFFLIFGYQIKKFYQTKTNSENIEKILLSKIYLQNDKQGAINLLNEIKKSDNNSISTLSSNELISFYLKEKNLISVMNEINFLKKKIGNDKQALTLLNIKEVLIKFDTIKEKEILELLKETKNDNFLLIKKKLLYDFYIKDNQIKKAEQFKLK